jgi:hypothetical protein
VVSNDHPYSDKVSVLAECSAKGAGYESQGQARSEAERVAPGKYTNERFRPERPRYAPYYALSGLDLNF